MTQSEQDDLILAHLDYARTGARAYVRGSRVPYDEYESAAFLGLVEAGRTFDPDKGAQFTTHAFHRIDARLKGVGWARRKAEGYARPITSERLQNAANGRNPYTLRRVVRVVPWPSANRGANRDAEYDFDIAGPDETADWNDRVDMANRLDWCARELHNPRERQIWSALLSGATLRDIAAQHGVSWQRISQIQSRIVKTLRRRARWRVATRKDTTT